MEHECKGGPSPTGPAAIMQGQRQTPSDAGYFTSPTSPEAVPSPSGPSQLDRDLYSGIANMQLQAEGRHPHSNPDLYKTRAPHHTTEKSTAQAHSQGGHPQIGSTSSSMYAAYETPTSGVEIIPSNSLRSAVPQTRTSNISGSVQSTQHSTLNPNVAYDLQLEASQSQLSYFQGGPPPVPPPYEQPPHAYKQRDNAGGSSTHRSNSVLGRFSSVNQAGVPKQATAAPLLGQPGSSSMSASSQTDAIRGTNTATKSPAHGRGDVLTKPSGGRHHGPPMSPSASYAGYMPPPQASTEGDFPLNYASTQGSSNRVGGSRLARAMRSSTSLPLEANASNVPSQPAWGIPQGHARGSNADFSMPGPSNLGYTSTNNPSRSQTFIVHTSPGIPPQENYPFDNQQLTNYPLLHQEWYDTHKERRA